MDKLELGRAIQIDLGLERESVTEPSHIEMVLHAVFASRPESALQVRLALDMKLASFLNKELSAFLRTWKALEESQHS